MSGIAKWKKKSAVKGWKALGGLSATAALSALLTPWLLFIGLPLSGYWTYEWLKYRAKRGMRF